LRPAAKKNPGVGCEGHIRNRTVNQNKKDKIMSRNTLQARAKGILMVGLSLMSGAVYQSCGGDLGGIGDYMGYGDMGYYSGGYGPIDQDVFDNAAADWDAYIRE